MKKVLFFFAMLAMLGTMTACGGDNASKDGATAKNEIKEGDSKALQMVKLTDQMVKVMEQEPNVEGYEAMMKLTMKMMELGQTLTSEEAAEIEKVAAEFDPAYADEKAMNEKMQGYQATWQQWAAEHADEVKEITAKYMGGAM